MRVIENENVRPFDVDGCLILNWDGPNTPLPVVDVKDPVNTHKFIKVRVNESMVRLLKEEVSRGSYIVVWSRSGYEWAVNVVRALGLEDLVDHVQSKPVVYFDDTPVQDWLKDRVFIGPDTLYKRPYNE